MRKVMMEHWFHNTFDNHEAFVVHSCLYTVQTVGFLETPNICFSQNWSHVKKLCLFYLLADFVISEQNKDSFMKEFSVRVHE